MKRLLNKIMMAVSLVFSDEWVVFIRFEGKEWREGVYTSFNGLQEVERRIEDIKYE